MWFGTQSGLSRYDGYRFRNFTHDAGDSTTLSDSYVLSIQELENGDLLLETRWKYVVYDYDKDRFINTIQDYFKGVLPTGGVSRIVVDESKNVWFTDHRFQLYRIDETGMNASNPFRKVSLETAGVSDLVNSQQTYKVLYTSGVIEYYDEKDYALRYHSEYLKGKLGNDSTRTFLFSDRDDDLWVYSAGMGTYYLQSSTNRWDHCTTQSGRFRLSSNMLKKIVQDNQGTLWIGTDHGGIDLVNKVTGQVTTLMHQEEDNKSLSQNSIIHLFKDNLGIVWIATYKKGICYYHENIFKFLKQSHAYTNPGSLPYNDVNCFSEDSRGNLWIGTNGHGLLYFDRAAGTYRTFRHQPEQNNSIGSDVVVNLFTDSNGILWIGTFTGGLTAWDGKRFTRYQFDLKTHGSLPHNNIWSIAQSAGGALFVATLGNGVAQFHAQDGTFHSPVSVGSIPLPSEFATSLCALRNGNMVIGTANGLALLDTQKKRYFTWPVAPDGSPLVLSNNNVHAILEDSRGLIWIATREGLNLYHPEKGTLHRFSKADGMSEGIYNCILEDDSRNIWVSKSDGISKIVLVPQDRDYRISAYHYTPKDGLQDNEFNVNSAYKTRKGELIFGGPNGFNLFLPQNISGDYSLPPILFSDFQVFNRSLKVGEKVRGRAILTESIASTRKITLPHHVNVFSIEFSAFDYLISQNISYRYRLEGFDADWMDVGNESRRITYTNLNPGSYTLRVEATHIDGLKSPEPALIEIEILPPFYASVPAYFLYFLLFVIALLWMRHILLKRERSRYLLEQERLHARRNHEMDEMKLRFLTNISHEFRTPLTLILTPLDRLQKEIADAAQRHSLDLIQKNARQLLQLVNQLLDFRKLDLHGLQYNPSHGDVVSFVGDIGRNFAVEFEQKHIAFHFQSNKSQFDTNFDQDKLEKIVSNLLSNALKFTPEYGSVQVALEISETEEEWILRVSDTGIGIHAEEHSRVFDRFYQSKNADHLASAGSGIGLNLTREMVTLHGGTISLESTPGAGSIFTVVFPYAGQAVIENEEGVPDETELPEEDEAVAEPEAVMPKRQVILLVEDNRDFRHYMKEVLEPLYEIITASHGADGWNKALQDMPDLIVSDVMMPIMDGHAFCAKVKNDVRTSHIPFIMLTARTADEDKITGFKTGADDYITKPFNMDLLLLRIAKKLDERRQYQKKFQKRIAIQPGEVEINSLDQTLIKKAIALVEQHIAEPEFTVEDLSRELGMSRVYLYKKLLSLTGKSPIEFIRIVRLKRAAQLLQKSNLTISEVAYQVGFNSPRYFSKYFRDEYGVLPSVFIQTHLPGADGLDQ